MLVDIIADIAAAEPDLIIVGEISRSNDLESAARRINADVVITREENREQNADQMQLLFVARPLRVLTITEDGRQGFCYELCPRRSALGEMSAAGLIAAIRARPVP